VRRRATAIEIIEDFVVTDGVVYASRFGRSADCQSAIDKLSALRGKARKSRNTRKTKFPTKACAENLSGVALQTGTSNDKEDDEVN